MINRKYGRRLLAGAACLMLAAVCMAGCSGSKEGTPDPDNDKGEVTMTVSDPKENTDSQNTGNTGEGQADTAADTSTPANEVTPTAEPTPTEEPTPTPTMSPAELYQEGIEKSLLSTGNNYRLKRVIEKARNGEDVYMCALGGSVTEGALAKTNDEGYAYLFADEFRSTYCPGDGSNLHFVNAGLSGTPSALGIIRYQQDVVGLLGADPDLLIIEFAINDYNEPTKGRAMESLIRRALEANEDCAVILLYSVKRGNWNMQDNYIKTGNYYSVQQVSIRKAVYRTNTDTRIAEALYFADEYHPTSYGHRFMKDCLMNLVKTVDEEEPSEKIKVPDNDYSGADFKDLIMLDSRDTKLDRLYFNPGSFSDTDDAVVQMYFTKKASFANNLYHKAGNANEPLKLKIRCKNILINYKTSSNKDFGTAQFLIDGEPVATADGYSQGAWNNCNVILILNEKESAEHTLEVKMAEGSEDKAFTILAIGYDE